MIMTERLKAAVENIMQTEPVRLCRLYGGRNSQVWKVDLADGRTVAAKKYFQRPRAGLGTDLNPRLESEWRALSFLAANGLDNVPRPLARDERQALAVYGFLEGRSPVRHGGREDYVAALAAFMERLRSLRGRPGAADLPSASEAAVDAADLIWQLNGRLARLRQVDSKIGCGAELHRFLDQQLEPALESHLAEFRPASPLVAGLAILSPSDFGFHNAIALPDNRMGFVDFEHFGWDDPAKLIVDTMLHPNEAMSLSPAQAQAFRRHMLEIHDDDRGLQGRVERLRPMLVLKWALILLNEFISDEADRRTQAGWNPSRPNLFRQLAKAERMLKRLDIEAL